MTKLNIVGLKKPVNQSCVEHIERMLADAKTGDLQDIAACGTFIDGSVMTTISTTENAIGRIAAVTRLLHRLNICMDSDHMRATNE